MVVYTPSRMVVIMHIFTLKLLTNAVTDVNLKTRFVLLKLLTNRYYLFSLKVLKIMMITRL